MIPVSSSFLSALQGSSRTFRAKIICDGSEVPCDIKNIITNKGASDSNSFVVGSVFSSHISIIASGLDTPLEDKDITLQIGIMTDRSTDTFDYVSIGKYTVIKVKKTTREAQVTATGFISSKLDELMPTVATQTLQNVVSAIKTATGVNISFVDFNPSGTITEPLTGLTCKEVLQIVTFLVGGFATENASGDIEIHKYTASESVLSVNEDRMLTPPIVSETDFEMSGIKVVVSAASNNEDGEEVPEVSYYYGDIRQSYSNKYMTESLFEGFKNNIIGYSFRPGEIDLSIGDPRLEPWDALEVTDAEGNVNIIPCHAITHVFDGGLSTQVVASGESSSETPVTGVITQQLERFSAELVTAREAIFERVKTGDLAATRAEIEALIATKASIENLNAQNARIETLEGDHVSVNDLNAAKGRIDLLEADHVSASDLTAATGRISNLETDNTNVKGRLTAAEGKISSLESDHAQINELKADKADITDLKAKDAEIENLVAGKASITDLESATARIGVLEADHVSATDIEAINLNVSGKADINFANITATDIAIAKIKEIFARTGWIEQIVSTEGEFTGRLTAVELDASAINTGTLKADRLLIKNDTSGLYYQLNLNAMGEAAISELTPEEQEALKNGLHGENLIAASVTADKIHVTDLFAFHATLGGMVVENYGFHTVGKTAINSPAQGIYVDQYGQFASGNADNYIVSYYDTEEEKWKVKISADVMEMGKLGDIGTVVRNAKDAAEAASEAVESMQYRMDSGEFKGEDATVLRIDSSRGNVFKNNAVSTVLTVNIIKGGETITTATRMKEVFGTSAYIQWLWKRMGEDTFHIILSTDSMISDDGFTLTLSPDNVDTKVTFQCELVI